MPGKLAQDGLSPSARARAVERARQIVKQSAGDLAAHEQARQAAFADYTPRAVRTDPSHAQAVPRASEIVRTISAQLQQLDTQRRRLGKLLEQLSGRD